MNVRFYLDPDTGEPHIHSHGITEEEVAAILHNPVEDRPGREESRMATGRARTGKHLRVIYVPDPEPDSIFVITAYELKGKPLVAYRRRRRRRGGR